MIYFLPAFRHKYFINLFTVVYFKKVHGAGEVAYWVRVGTALADSQDHVRPHAVISSPASR